MQSAEIIILCVSKITTNVLRVSGLTITIPVCIRAPFWLYRHLRLRSLRPQRAQYGLIEEYTLLHIGILHVIQAMFLHYAVYLYLNQSIFLFLSPELYLHPSTKPCWVLYVWKVCFAFCEQGYSLDSNATLLECEEALERSVMSIARSSQRAQYGLNKEYRCSSRHRCKCYDMDIDTALWLKDGMFLK